MSSAMSASVGGYNMDSLAPGATVFQNAVDACQSYQTGTVNMRRILAPLYDEEMRESEIRAFYTEANNDPYGYSMVQTGVSNAGLYLPDMPNDMNLEFVANELNPQVDAVVVDAVVTAGIAIPSHG